MNNSSSVSSGTSMEDFLSKLASRPHVAENIIRRLNLCDVANCLKLSKPFRQFIIDALLQCPHLKDELEKDASKHALTDEELDAKECGPLDEDHWKHRSFDKKSGFGLDGSLWICRPSLPVGHQSYVPFSSRLPQDHILCVYDMPSNKKVLLKKRIQYISGSRPRVRIMPDRKILLQDSYAIWLLEKKKDLLHHIMADVEKEAEPPRRDFICDDCIFRSMMHPGDRFKRVINLCGADGDLMYRKAIKTNLRPRQMLQKVTTSSKH